MSKSFQHKKPPLPCSSADGPNYPSALLVSSRRALVSKYTSSTYTNDYIQTNYLIFNEKCRSVALFKDYLVYDDNTEFLKRYYKHKELTPKLKTIFAFYETYSRIFPNYMILPESEYLYRNIRKKQKMIDAFNQIRKEEEENRKHLNINSAKRCASGAHGYKKNVVFDKQVRRSINKCEPSEIKNNNIYFNNKDNDESSLNGDSISISLVSKKQLHVNSNNAFNTPNCSFANEDNSFASIALIIQGMDRNVMQLETPKRKNNNTHYTTNNANNNASTPRNGNGHANAHDNTNEFDEFDEHSHHHIQSALNNNRKFISHKSTASVPDMNNNSIKIINNYHKIIIPQGTTNAVININAHIYQCDSSANNVNALSPSSTANTKDNVHTHSNTQLSNASLIVNANHIKSNTAIKGFQTNMLTHNNNNSKSLSKSKNYSMQKNNTNSYLNTQSNNNNHHKGAATITTSSAAATGNKNGYCFNINTKSLSKKKYSHHHSNNKLNEYKAESSLTNSAFKSPEKILSLSKKKNITTTVTTTNHIMPIYKNKHFSNIQTLSALQNNKVNPFKSKFQRKKTIQKHNTNNSLSVNKDKNARAKQEQVVVCKSNEANSKGVGFDNMVMVTNGNNNHHNSIEVNNRNSVNSQRKPVNLKTPLVKKVIMSPKNANVGGYVMSLVERSKVPLTEKVKLTQKCPLNREMIKSKGIFACGNGSNSNNNPSKIIKGFNMRGVDANTAKMKFLRK